MESWNRRPTDMDQKDNENFYAFRKNILPHTCNEGIVLCGSFYEQPLEYAMLNLTDLDHLFFDRKLIAATETAIISKYWNKEILALETKNCHLGYTRLLRRREEKTEYFEWSRQSLHGPAITTRLMTLRDVSKIFMAALKCRPNLNLQVFKDLTADYVYSVLCPCWPQEAAEWLTRERCRDWPTKDLIATVVAGGCHLVPKSHHSNPNDDTVWRFSFSQAELILVNSWNEVQTYIYHILRILKSDVIAKCGGEKTTFLCTYYFKTLMLWACENKPPDFWNEDQIEATIEELLLQMIQWLIDKNCPNYFIRENNMLDFMEIDLDVSNEVKLLLAACEDIQEIMAREPKVDRDKILHVRVSDKAVLLCQLGMNRRVFVNAMNQKLGRYALKNLPSSALLSHEVDYLFRAIQSHCLLMSNEENIDVKRKTYETDALSFFQISYNKKGTGNYSDVYISSLDSLSCTVNKFLYGTHDEGSQRMCRDCVTEGNTSTGEPMEALFKVFAEIIDGNQPEPSFLISAAYFANFYYTGLQDFRQAIKICEETLASVKDLENVVSLNALEHAYANETLCIFINRQYIDIHDAGVQAVYGFLTLCNTMTIIKQTEKIGSEREVLCDLVLQVCPVEFLRYIEIRCRNELLLCKRDCPATVVKHFFRVPDIERATGLRKLSNAILSTALCFE